MSFRQTGDDDVMSADAAECVYIGFIGTTIKILVFFVEHLLRRGKFDGEGAYPSYSVVFEMRSASLRHLGRQDIYGLLEKG